MDSDDDTTIGMGGWALVVLSGVVTFAVLRGWLYYHPVPAALFSLAIALIVVLVLFRLAVAVNRYDDAEEEAHRVRKVVPATADVGMRIGGDSVATTPSAMAVPVRAEGSVVPQRPSSVMTPLASIEAAPVILPPVMAAPLVADAVVLAPVAKAAAKPKAEAKAKVAKPKAEKPAAVAKSTGAAGAKPKAEPKPKVEPKPKAEKSAKPKTAKAAAPQGLVRLTAPRLGQPDDLQEIEGIGPALEKLVNSLGFYHFDQIAGWTDADAALVDAEMKTFKGRIARDKWVEQARIIVNDGLEAFREHARANDY